MKKLLLVATASLLLVACGSRSKLNSDIRAHRTNIARNASYNLEHAELFLTLNQVVSNRYTIAKESESKGTIATEVNESSNTDKSRTTKTWLEAEIVGSEKPYRVDFQYKTETTSFTAGKGINTTTKRNRRVEDDLAVQLYEKVKGKIELTPTLKKRIDGNNNAAKREGQKIYY